LIGARGTADTQQLADRPPSMDRRSNRMQAVREALDDRFHGSSI
jgi:hypothetical protein